MAAHPIARTQNAPRYEDRVVFETGLVRIGMFRCDRDHPVFRNTGPAENYSFVFPRTAVMIAHEHDRPFVSNPTNATFYNARQEYERHPVDGRGDYCDWFAIKPDAIADIRQSMALDADSPLLFPTTHARIDDRTYLLQRQVFEHVMSGAPVNALFVEEAVLMLLERLLCVREERTVATVSARHLTLVRDVQALLSRAYGEALSMGDIARSTGTSEYHLARVFRRVTGQTLHGYRHTLRTRHALEPVAHAGTTLTDIAMGLGFSSQSHFTEAFRQAFGLLPSEFRRLAWAGPIAA